MATETKLIQARRVFNAYRQQLDKLDTIPHMTGSEKFANSVYLEFEAIEKILALYGIDAKQT